ncbi:hypothetical protein VWZ88_14810 [Phaeobacter sp. JH20_36]|uniref:hypothetical protein n=1 Tax=unclassified Phaeobacter TaxID=2621772 RepID=UPI003A86FCB6
MSTWQRSFPARGELSELRKHLEQAFNGRSGDTGCNAAKSVPRAQNDAASAKTKNSMSVESGSLLVHGTRSESRSTPDRPLVQIAAKVSGEPTAEVLNSCCARSQQQNCRDCIIFSAAARRGSQSFALLYPPEDTRSSEEKIREGFAIGGTGGASRDVGDTKKERFCHLDINKPLILCPWKAHTRTSLSLFRLLFFPLGRELRSVLLTSLAVCSTTASKIFVSVAELPIDSINRQDISATPVQ